MPTEKPCRETAAARLTVMLDLPTPPLPLVTAITRVKRVWRERIGGGLAVSKSRDERCPLVCGHHTDSELHRSLSSDPGERLANITFNGVCCRTAHDGEPNLDSQR